MPPLRIVQVAAEVFPFAKVGGLADVSSGLSVALAGLGHDVTLILPRYRQIEKEGLERVPLPDGARVRLGPVAHPFGILRGRHPGGDVEVLFLENDAFFDRWSVYNAEGGKPFADDTERWLFFQRGAVEVMRALGVRPDVVHTHDSQSALVPGLLATHPGAGDQFRGTASVFTIHNLAYQGVHAPEANRLAELPWDWLAPGGPLEADGTFNWMKGGIALAHGVTTVSPTYAREVQSAERGLGLDGVLRSRGAAFTGVLNGIDPAVWSPRTDPRIPHHYDADDRQGKRDCKRALLETLGLPAESLDVPLLAFVGRLVPQKGCELFEPVLRDVLQHDVRGVFLGSGANQYEDLLRGLETAHPGKFRARIGFDDEMAHWIEAGADVFLMPSRYEPCGLNQMYSMAYGTVPVVHATGGLADTVFEAPGGGTGFVFHRFDAHEFKQAVYRALAAYQDRELWQRIVGNAMQQDFTWARSAARYVEVYEAALARARA